MTRAFGGNWKLGMAEALDVEDGFGLEEEDEPLFADDLDDPPPLPPPMPSLSQLQSTQHLPTVRHPERGGLKRGSPIVAWLFCSLLLELRLVLVLGVWHRGHPELLGMGTRDHLRRRGNRYSP